MKKTVALLLCVAMLLGAAACKSEETTKKSKKKTKKTTDTKITETEEPTDEPSETEGSSETSDSEETSDTTEAETEATTVRTYSEEKVPFEVFRDMDDLGLKYGCYYQVYGAVDQTLSSPDYVHEGLTSISFEFNMLTATKTNKKIAGVIEDIFKEEYTRGKSVYEIMLKDFIEKEDKGEALPYWYYEFVSQPCRADSSVVSFMTSVLSYEGEYLETPHNLRGEDGTTIEFSDIVKDRGALWEYIKNVLESSPDAMSDGRGLDELEDSVMNAWANFVIMTNGILINGVFVPAYACPEAFDTSYFESIAKNNYSVWSDNFGHLAWDIDADGILDEIDIELTHTDEGMNAKELKIYWNFSEYTFDQSNMDAFDEIGFEAHGYVDPKIMVTENGTYLLMKVYREMDLTMVLFELEPGNIRYCDYLATDLVMADQSPDAMLFMRYHNALGNTALFQDYRIGSDGKFQKISTNEYSVYPAIALKVELEVTKIDDNGNITGTTKLPAGTRLTLSSYNEDSNTGCFEIISRDNNQGQRVLIALSEIGSLEDTFQGLPEGG
ncbi:MAG: hypothetical protein IKZ90_04400 [Clostridiales bacterium]|nr:hypothetical protein [Clostridiales bacterium]